MQETFLCKTAENSDRYRAYTERRGQSRRRVLRILLPHSLRCKEACCRGACRKTGWPLRENATAPRAAATPGGRKSGVFRRRQEIRTRSEEHTSELQSHSDLVCR